MGRDPLIKTKDTTITHLKNKKVFTVEFSFTETVKGEIIADDKEEAISKVTEHYTALPDFTVVSTTELKVDPEEYLASLGKVSAQIPPDVTIN